MTRRTGVAVAIVATLLMLSVPSGARAQSTASGGVEVASANASALAEVEANRAGVIREVVERWRSQLQRANPSENIDDGEAALTGALHRASPEKLLAASQAQSYEEALAALNGRWQGPSVVPLEPGSNPNSIGSTSSDLVFTPITPCRIIDTRIATGAFAGQIPANTGKQFSVNLADFSAQGGSATNCGMPTTFDVSGVAINVTSTGQTGLGNIAVIECGGGVPTVSLLNYTPGVNLANAAVVRSAIGCGLGGDIYVRSNNSASNVVVDIMGYFAAPVLTLPDQYVVSTGGVSIGPGTQTIFTTDCPAGYRLAGTAGLINSWGSTVVFIGARPTTGNSVALVSGANAGTQACCQFRNDTVTNQNVVCQAICLRIPGR